MLLSYAKRLGGLALI